MDDVWKKKSEQSNPTSSCGMSFRRFFRKENPQISPTDSQMPLRRLYVFFKPEQSSGYGGSLRKRDGFVVHHGVDARAIHRIFNEWIPRMMDFVEGISGFRYSYFGYVRFFKVFFLVSFSEDHTQTRSSQSISIVLSEQTIRVEVFFRKSQFLSEMRECCTLSWQIFGSPLYP